MDLLNAIGSIASIIGLIVTFYTLYKVANLPAALKQRSRDNQISEMIDKINRFPRGKREIPDSTAREVEALIRSIRLYYVSRLPWRQGDLKALLASLEGELGGQKQPGVVKHLLGLIRDEITIR